MNILQTGSFRPIVRRKAGSLDHSLRVWSTGCSTGDEPYSIAILANEFMKKEDLKLDLNIFATDIDEWIGKTGKDS